MKPLTEPVISDKAQHDWDISSNGTGLTDQRQSQIDNNESEEEEEEGEEVVEEELYIIMYIVKCPWNGEGKSFWNSFF